MRTRDRALGYFVILVVVSVIVYVSVSAASYVETRKQQLRFLATADCSLFGNYKRDELPVRCIAYWTTTASTPQH